MYWDKQIQRLVYGEVKEKNSPEDEKEIKTKNELTILGQHRTVLILSYLVRRSLFIHLWRFLGSDGKNLKNSNANHESTPSNGTLVVSPETEVEETEQDGGNFLITTIFMNSA